MTEAQPTVTPALADPEFRLLGERVSEAMVRLGIPGVAVGVVHGERVLAAGFGVTNVEHPLPVDADTLFSIGSISKSFTATALLRLLPGEPPLGDLPGAVVTQGLDLDAPLRTYLSGLRLADEDATARVTARHLLTHTGGWVGWDEAWAGPRDYGRDALARALPRMAELPQLTSVGEHFSYSNNGYALAGRLLEVLTGRPFDVAVSRLVFEPLGLTRATFFARWAITHRVAVGHLVQEGRAQVHRSTPWGINPVYHAAGGVAATVHEVLRFARLYLDDGVAPGDRRLLTPQTIAASRTPQSSVDGAGTTYGLGWFLRDLGGVQTVAHGGYIDSISLLTLVPAHRFAVAVLANAYPERLDHEITRWALEHYLGLVTPDAKVVERPAEALGEYAGRYTGVARPFDLEVQVEGKALAVRRVSKAPTHAKGPTQAKDPQGGTPSELPSPAERFVFCARDRVVPAADLKGAQFDFLRDPGGRIAWFRYGRQLYPRQSP
ncbi:MAG TPA: serine hydrolase domain-containing protein [Chloroflexota bacterium]|nr:serine hydrolase domain-containing protein [Chloroflexota bacterium]